MVGEDVVATQAISAFAEKGDILGLIILALLVIVGLVVWVVGGYMKQMLKAHEERLDKTAFAHNKAMDEQEARHRAEREAAEHRWTAVSREISEDIKSAFVTVNGQHSKVVEAIDRFEVKLNRLKRVA